MRSLLLVSAPLLPFALATQAAADCCHVTKTDTELPPATVRVCEPGPNGACGTLLFEGLLELGESREVCSAGSTIVYEEFDALQQVFLEPVEARCEGGDVEL